MDSTNADQRPEPPPTADEVATVLGFLEYQRATLEMKCRGVDPAGLAATIEPSSMSLGGLLKHLAYVEDHWFHRAFADRPPCEPWASVDWSADRDWDWNSAAEDDVDELFGLWRAAVGRSRAIVAEVLLGPDPLDRRAEQDVFDGHPPSLRWILLHMVEEYARHNGHADLLRERFDGSVGE